MSAAADYAAASAALSKPLPAYVSYTTQGHTKFDAMSNDQTHHLVVRTSDGAIVKGDASASNSVQIGKGRSFNTSDNVLKNPPFKPSCYQALSAKTVTFEGRSLEAIALRGHCDDENDNDQKSDFDTLYVDPASHEPVAAVGYENKELVIVNIETRFARTDAYVLPASLNVRVKGSGLMFWLDVLADFHYSNYRFSDKAP